MICLPPTPCLTLFWWFGFFNSIPKGCQISQLATNCQLVNMQFYKFQIHINYLDHEWLCAIASLGYSKNRALLGVLLLYYYPHNWIDFEIKTKFGTFYYFGCCFAVRLPISTYDQSKWSSGYGLSPQAKLRKILDSVGGPLDWFDSFSIKKVI